ncbi:MAG: transcriptional regulator [Candidatus Geothermarchaeales archaeon]
MSKFIRCGVCEECEVEIPPLECVFAVHKRVIDGEEHLFCCERCADEYERRVKHIKS